jgi:hypothetical protein
MINNIKGEVEKRTGLSADVVDKVVNALGEIVSERYPQYAGMIGPILGTSATSATGTTGESGLPDMRNLGAALGGLGMGKTDQDAGSGQNNTSNGG